jgi:bleomycin hydrolase
MKHYNLEEFEFSQSYLFFYDKVLQNSIQLHQLNSDLIYYFSVSFKLERCNYFLQNMVETYKRGEPVDGRLIAFLLNVSLIHNHS